MVYIYIYIAICVYNSVLFLILNTFIIFNILIGFTSIHLSHMPRIDCWCASILEILFGCFTTRWRNRLGGIVRNIRLQTILLLGSPEFLEEAEIWDLSWSWWWGCWHHLGEWKLGVWIWKYLGFVNINAYFHHKLGVEALKPHLTLWSMVS